MRRFRNLAQSQQSGLRAQFPDIDKVLAVEETDNYSYLAVSVFDHWLDQGEANRLLSNVSNCEQKLRDEKFDQLSRIIISTTDVYNFTIKGKGAKSSIVFREFTSDKFKEEYMMSASNYVSSNLFFHVALPELGALYFESWDDTNVFYLRNDDHKDLIKSWANKCGLFCLDKW